MRLEEKDCTVTLASSSFLNLSFLFPFFSPFHPSVPLYLSPYPIFLPAVPSSLFLLLLSSYQFPFIFNFICTFHSITQLPLFFFPSRFHISLFHPLLSFLTFCLSFYPFFPLFCPHLSSSPSLPRLFPSLSLPLVSSSFIPSLIPL